MERTAMAGEPLWFEDLVPGRRFESRWVELTAEDIIGFARQFDPQPFHLDREAGRRSVLGDLAASGWHTASLTMRLIVDSDMRLADGSIGMGVENLRWRRPVLVGDRITAVVEVAAARPSRSDAATGVVTLEVTTRNQRDEIVQQMSPTILVRRRPA